MLGQRGRPLGERLQLRPQPRPRQRGEHDGLGELCQKMLETSPQVVHLDLRTNEDRISSRSGNESFSFQF